ncbi:MAG: MopE-related protein, partial [Myxococcota bacterium]
EDPNEGVSCTSDRFGACAPGVLICQENNLVCVSDIEPTEEVCNGIDDNCDGIVDDGNPEGGDSCGTGQMGACAQGTLTCQEGSVVCLANAQPTSEVCNGIDDDCDGLIDEDGSGCGPYVQQRCRLYAGSAEGGTGPAIGSLSDRWERCPYQTDFDNGGPVRCSGTRGDGRFSILPLGHQVNGDDKFGLSMHCNDGAHPAQARYIEEHCRCSLPMQTPLMAHLWRAKPGGARVPMHSWTTVEPPDAPRQGLASLHDASGPSAPTMLCSIAMNWGSLGYAVTTTIRVVLLCCSAMCGSTWVKLTTTQSHSLGRRLGAPAPLHPPPV